MNRIIASFLGITALLICSCSNSSETDLNDTTTEIDSNYCNCDELIFDGAYNHYFRFKKREGFTGICESFYPSGQKSIIKHFDDGKLEGKMTSFYENGQVSEEMEFMTNFQTGFQTNFNENGDTIYHALYKRGNLIEIYIQ